MITGTVWGVTLLIAGFIASLVAMQIVLAALFPAAHRASRRALRARPVVSIAVGLPAAVVAALVAVGASKVPGVGPLLAALLLLPLIVALALGLAATSAEVGARMPSSGAAASDWRSLVRGAVAVLLASLLPLAGWVVAFPLSIAAGFGALLLAPFGVGRPGDADRAPAGQARPPLTTPAEPVEAGA